jgi:hypothetical protein
VEKEGRRVATLPSPFSMEHMDNNQESSEVQAHLDQFFAQLARCPELEGQARFARPAASPDAGLAQELKGVLREERQFHLDEHREDRADGSPQAQLASRTQRRVIGAASHPPKLLCGRPIT